LAAEAFVLFLDKKNQKSSHLPMLLFAQGLYPAKRGSTTGCLDLRLGFARTWPALHANLKGPHSRTRPPCTPPLSPEAGEHDENPSLTLPKGEGIKNCKSVGSSCAAKLLFKKSVGLPAHPAGCMALCSGRDCAG